MRGCLRLSSVLGHLYRITDRAGFVIRPSNSLWHPFRDTGFHINIVHGSHHVRMYMYVPPNYFKSFSLLNICEGSSDGSSWLFNRVLQLGLQKPCRTAPGCGLAFKSC